MACATNSLPVPDSPSISTLASVGATVAICASTFWMAGLATPNSGLRFNAIDFAWRFNGDGRADILENGRYQPGVDEDWLASLERRGRSVRRWPARHHFFGGVSAIGRSGAGADPRRSGAVTLIHT